jgi:hypothetical protein
MPSSGAGSSPAPSTPPSTGGPEKEKKQ